MQIYSAFVCMFVLYVAKNVTGVESDIYLSPVKDELICKMLVVLYCNKPCKSTIFI